MPPFTFEIGFGDSDIDTDPPPEAGQGRGIGDIFADILAGIIGGSISEGREDESIGPPLPPPGSVPTQPQPRGTTGRGQQIISGVLGDLLRAGVQIAAAGGLDSIRGKELADAAKEAAALQFDAAIRAGDIIVDAREAARADLGPFREFGERALPEIENILSDPAGFLRSSDLFQASLEHLDEATEKRAASRGRLAAGDTEAELFQNFQLAADPILNNIIAQRFNQAQLGQASAAQQANTALTAGSSIADLLLSGSAARAGGVVGAANARAQGDQNLAGLAALLLG